MNNFFLQVLQFFWVLHTPAVQTGFGLFNFYFLGFRFRGSVFELKAGMEVIGLGRFYAAECLAQFNIIFQRLVNGVQLRARTVNLSVNLL